MATTITVPPGEVWTVTLKMGSGNSFTPGEAWAATRQNGSNVVPLATYVAGSYGNGELEMTVNLTAGSYTLNNDTGHTQLRLTNGGGGGSHKFNDVFKAT